MQQLPGKRAGEPPEPLLRRSARSSGSFSTFTTTSEPGFITSVPNAATPQYRLIPLIIPPGSKNQQFELGAALGIAAIRLLDMNPLLATSSVISALTAAIALSGLAVGIGAAQPQFKHTNPNELAMAPGAIIYMALAMLYAAVVTVLLARPAWSIFSNQAGAGYWLTGEGLLILAALGLVTAITTGVPLVHGSRRLERFEA